jgi:glycosyltransferase involved in cell wall biosynthesis
MSRLMQADARSAKEGPGAVVRLLRSASRHLRERGPRYLISRAWHWSQSKFKAAIPAAPLVLPPPGGYEVGGELDPRRLSRVTGNTNGLVVQEIPLDYDELHSIEILVESFGVRQPAPTYVLLGPSNNEICRGELLLPASFMSAYARLQLPKAISSAGLSRVFLVLEPALAWRTASLWGAKSHGGRLWTGVDPSRVADIGKPGALGPVADESLVYRLTVRDRVNEPKYRWPSAPRDHAIAPRVVALRELDSGEHHRAEAADALEALKRGDCDLLLAYGVRWSDALERVLLQSFRLSIPTVYVTDGHSLQVEAFAPPVEARQNTLKDPNVARFLRRRAMVACDIVVALDSTAREIANRERKPTLLARQDELSNEALATLQGEYRRIRRPRVSIITLLYNKARELPWVLPTYMGQSYEGEIEFVFVDDCSHDESIELVKRFQQELACTPVAGPRCLTLLSNDANAGNCSSRNRGIQASNGDLLVIIDVDCMLNKDFVVRHVDAHAFCDCEVVIGPFNIETGEDAPDEVLARFESDPLLASGSAQLQDSASKASFLNCITRNFSIKRGALPSRDPLFDPLFGYSADPCSGFGWEDVEMGYRLYKDGARIKYVADAFSIHVSAPAGPEGHKPLRSLLNFRRLLEKHPDLVRVVPKWSRETYKQIIDWCRRVGLDPAEHDRVLAVHFAGASAQQGRRASGGRRLRVLTYRWHVPHQYELWKLPIDVTLVVGTGSGMCDKWDYGQRPLPPNVRFRPLDEIREEDYDLAILHFDENVLAPENTNGVIGPEWGSAFRTLKESFKLPKIAICHGTPQFFGQYNFDYAGSDLMKPIEVERRRLVVYLGDTPVVCNSHQAQEEWGFRRSTVIWHGFDPAEFPPATRERGIVSPLGPLVLSRPHYRGYFLYRDVFDGCWEELRPQSLRVPEPHPAYSGNGYARAKFQRYVDELRRYSVYFNPTLRSPMPRARGEPMMCGVVTVSARNHDVDRFIDNGVDGFYANEAGELREQLRFLTRNSAACLRMGEAARAKAIKVFHVERYLQDWQMLIRAST